MDNKELVTPKQIADHIGMTARNVNKTYKQDGKEDFLEVLQLGTFCKINRIRPQDLKALVPFRTELKSKEKK